MRRTNDLIQQLFSPVRMRWMENIWNLHGNASAVSHTARSPTRNIVLELSGYAMTVNFWPPLSNLVSSPSFRPPADGTRPRSMVV